MCRVTLDEELLTQEGPQVAEFKIKLCQQTNQWNILIFLRKQGL